MFVVIVLLVAIIGPYGLVVSGGYIAITLISSFGWVGFLLFVIFLRGWYRRRREKARELALDRSNDNARIGEEYLTEHPITIV